MNTFYEQTERFIVLGRITVNVALMDIEAHLEKGHYFLEYENEEPIPFNGKVDYLEHMRP